MTSRKVVFTPCASKRSFGGSWRKMVSRSSGTAKTSAALSVMLCCAVVRCCYDAVKAGVGSGRSSRAKSDRLCLPLSVKHVRPTNTDKTSGHTTLHG